MAEKVEKKATIIGRVRKKGSKTTSKPVNGQEQKPE